MHVTMNPVTGKHVGDICMSMEAGMYFSLEHLLLLVICIISTVSDAPECLKDLPKDGHIPTKFQGFLYRETSCCGI